MQLEICRYVICSLEQCSPRPCQWVRSGYSITFNANNIILSTSMMWRCNVIVLKAGDRRKKVRVGLSFARNIKVAETKKSSVARWVSAAAEPSAFCDAPSSSRSLASREWFFGWLRCQVARNFLSGINFIKFWPNIKIRGQSSEKLHCWSNMTANDF